MASHRSMSREEGGRKGAEAQWSKRNESQPSRSSDSKKYNRENSSSTSRQESSQSKVSSHFHLDSYYYPESYREINPWRGLSSAEEYEPLYFREIGRRRGAQFNELNSNFYEEKGPFFS